MAIDTAGMSAEAAAGIKAQEKLQAESQAFQLGQAQLQAKDAMEKSKISFQEALAASDRANADRVAQFASK